MSILGGSGTRIKNVSIIGRALLEASDERIKAINMGMNPQLARLVYNKYQAGIRHFMMNYLSYFSPQFYLTNGPAEGTYGMIPGRGVLYWIDGLFLISFFIYVVRNHKNKILWLLIVWYLLSPIPAALSLGPGYAANRAEAMVPVLQMMLAIGVVYLLEYISDNKYRWFAASLFVCFYLIFITYFGIEYFMLSPLKNGKAMLWGSLKSAQYTVNKYPNSNILISRSLSEPHIYFAFASKFDPILYQSETLNWDYKKRGLSWVDQMPEYKLGNFVFSDINKKNLESGIFEVVVGKPEEFDKSIIPTEIIYNPDRSEAVYILEQ